MRFYIFLVMLLACDLAHGDEIKIKANCEETFVPDATSNERYPASDWKINSAQKFYAYGHCEETL